VYKDPTTNRKISIISPALALGQSVHEVVEALSVIPVNKRFSTPLNERFEQVWKKVEGEKGGFLSEAQEERFKNRGRKMLKRVMDNPGPIERLAVKIRQELPYFWLSEPDEIIMCGKIDWLEYLADEDGVHIVDFKTGKKQVKTDSMQLPMYQLLAEKTQKRPVLKASYWYLEHDDKPEEQELADTKEVGEAVLKTAKQIKLQKKLDRLNCPKNGCGWCKPYENILEGKAQKVGVNDFGQDLYVVDKLGKELESDIL
jgi:hypothetical protein